jgi:hypothetical protein
LDFLYANNFSGLTIKKNEKKLKNARKSFISLILFFYILLQIIFFELEMRNMFFGVIRHDIKKYRFPLVENI